MYLTPGTDGSIALYGESVLSTIGDQLGQYSPNGTDVRTFSRLFYAQAHRVELDRQGRVRIPAELVRWASMTREIILLGVRDHLEIWDRARWDEYLASNQLRFDEIAEDAFKPGATAGPPEPTLAPSANKTDAETLSESAQTISATENEATAGTPNQPR